MVPGEPQKSQDFSWDSNSRASGTFPSTFWGHVAQHNVSSEGLLDCPLYRMELGVRGTSWG